MDTLGMCQRELEISMGLVRCGSDEMDGQTQTPGPVQPERITERGFSFKR
jgi:hypothetical protein